MFLRLSSLDLLLQLRSIFLLFFMGSDGSRGRGLRIIRAWKELARRIILRFNILRNCTWRLIILDHYFTILKLSLVLVLHLFTLTYIHYFTLIVKCYCSIIYILSSLFILPQSILVVNIEIWILKPLFRQTTPRSLNFLITHIYSQLIVKLKSFIQFLPILFPLWWPWSFFLTIPFLHFLLIIILQSFSHILSPWGSYNNTRFQIWLTLHQLIISLKLILRRSHWRLKIWLRLLLVNCWHCCRWSRKLS